MFGPIYSHSGYILLALLVWGFFGFLFSGLVAGCLGILAGLRACRDDPGGDRSRTAIRRGSVALVLGSLVLGLILPLCLTPAGSSYMTALFAEPPIALALVSIGLGLRARASSRRRAAGIERRAGLRVRTLMLAIAFLAVCLAIPIQVERLQRARDYRERMGYARERIEWAGGLARDSRYWNRDMGQQYFAGIVVEAAREGVALSERLGAMALTESEQEACRRQRDYFAEKAKEFAAMGSDPRGGP